MLSLLLLASFSSFNDDLVQRTMDAPLDVHDAIALKFSGGVDLQQLRDKIVAQSVSLDLLRRRHFDSVPLTSQGFSCARARREGRTAAVLVVVGNAASVEDAWSSWHDVESQAYKLKRSARRALTLKLNEYWLQG